MTESEFEHRWRAAAGFRQVAASLRSLIRSVVAEASGSSPDVAAVRTRLESLLEFLTGEGRTDANCAVTDAFFSSIERDSPEIWSELPQPLSGILRDLGGALHDSVHAPRIAATFDSLPEQLLDRLRRS